MEDNRGIVTKWLIFTIVFIGLAVIAFVKIQQERWNRALALRHYLDFSQKREKVSLHPGLLPGDSLSKAPPNGEVVVDLSPFSWAHVSGSRVISLTGTALYLGDKVIAREGDGVGLIQREIGYPDRMVGASNGADFVYFVGPKNAYVLRVIAVKGAIGDLKICLIQMAKASGPPFLLEGTH